MSAVKFCWEQPQSALKVLLVDVLPICDCALHEANLSPPKSSTAQQCMCVGIALEHRIITPVH